VTLEHLRDIDVKKSVFYDDPEKTTDELNSEKFRADRGKEKIPLRSGISFYRRLETSECTRTVVL
jgi:hypothetical protein